MLNDGFQLVTSITGRFPESHAGSLPWCADEFNSRFFEYFFQFQQRLRSAGRNIIIPLKSLNSFSC